LLRREIFKGYQFILPITFLILLIVYFFRSLIITFVLSTSFSGIEDYFLPQVIGDFFKISSWLLAYLMIAKAMVKQYILTELIFSLFIVLFSRFCVDHFGGIGAIYAYAINYFLYLLTMLFLFRRLIAKGEMK
jgi:PST family polysaccharide transporter